MSESRLARVRSLMERPTAGGEILDAMFVTGEKNRYYLTGFNGSSGYVLITADRAILFTDFRYVEQAQSQAPLFEVIQHSTPYTTAVRQVVGDLGLNRIGFEAGDLSVEQHGKLAADLPGVTLLGTTAVVETLRATKEPDEISRIESAVACADAAFARVLDMGIIRPGLTEQEIAATLEHQMRLGGASSPAFETIVASGPRSALPHGRASRRELQRGDLVTMDFGAVVEGYCSDITRTVVVGRASPEQRQVYDLVLQAQTAGVNAVRPGLTGRQADPVARGVIEAAGHGGHFGHGLGHGVGLAVHEAPRLSPPSEQVLAAGMVTSIESGIYRPGWGGVRIEDLVCLTGEGCRVLTRTTKQLIEV